MKTDGNTRVLASDRGSDNEPKDADQQRTKQPQLQEIEYLIPINEVIQDGADRHESHADKASYLYVIENNPAVVINERLP